jgi:pimeloyl-ACP methyl ester carboxylesterase
MISKNIIINSTQHQKPISADFKYLINGEKKPLILFVHGFKGFKDWGVFNKMAASFATKNFIFLKMNFSHNGTTVDSPVDFVDLEAFGHNNFTKELADLKDVIDYIHSGDFPIAKSEIDLDNIHLMGHSRGGGAVILKAREDDRIRKVVTLAAINDLTTRYPDAVLQQWKDKGVIFIDNARTGQQMPLYLQLYDDVTQNSDRFSIPDAVKEMSQPLLNFHGTADETLPISMAHEIKKWKPDTELVIFDDANHVFGAAHPWNDSELPVLFKEIIEISSSFLRKD